MVSICRWSPKSLQWHSFLSIQHSYADTSLCTVTFHYSFLSSCYAWRLQKSGILNGWNKMVLQRVDHDSDFADTGENTALSIICPCWYGNTEAGYCFALWLGDLGPSSHSGLLGCHILPFISVASNVRPLKLNTCLMHKNLYFKKSFVLGWLGYQWRKGKGGWGEGRGGGVHRCWWPLTLIITLAGDQSVRSSVPMVSRWLWPGTRPFSKVISMMVTWWIVAFFTQCSASFPCKYISLPNDLPLQFPSSFYAWKLQKLPY